MHKRPVLLLTLLLGTAAVFAQNRPTSPEELLKTGIGFYSEGRFSEALTVLRLVTPKDGPYAEALYWASLSALSAGNHDGALLLLDDLEKTGENRWTAGIPYQRARCFFYSGRHEEALALFTSYGDSFPEGDPRRAAAYYWEGESLFAMGRLDGAADAFSTVVERYPSSVKYEAASYRLDLINQKKIENELLGILKWSHEESLKSLEEYQNREKAYEEAIAGYQRRITEILDVETAGGSSAGDGEYREELARAEIRIAALELSLAEANAALEELRGTEAPRGTPPESARRPMTDTEKALRILELKTQALQLSGELTAKLNGEEAP